MVAWRALLGTILLLSLMVPAQADLSPEDILAQADEVRSPQLDYRLRVTVTDVHPQKTPRVSTYEVLIKDRNRTVVKTLSPPVDRGRILLMRGRDLWAFLPTLSKPLRISLAERLTGEVANGDLARANFSGDYTPTLDEVEPRGETGYYVLNLTAVADDVTYARVMLWVEQGTLHPSRAEFYAYSGRLLKTCTYEQYRELAGRRRPTRLVMKDPLIHGRYSVIAYDQMEIVPLSEKYFTKDYLKRLTDH
jgi:hypothetical protein